MDKKRRKKRNKRRRKRRKKLFSKPFISFLILIGVLTVGINTYRHDYFKISQVFIEGNKILSDDEILQKLNDPVSKNIFSYDEDKSLKLLKDQELVKDAKLKKQYPDKLLVSVKEEYPFMKAEFKNKDYTISNTSIVIDENKEVKDKRLTELKGLRKKPMLGEKFTNNQNVIDFVNSIQTFSYSLDLDEIDLENYDDIGIIINDIQINFGSLKNYNYKLKLLDSVLKDIEDKGLRAYTISLDKGKDPVVEIDEEKSLDQKD